MKRVFKYGFFVGMSPLCPVRIATYPELAFIADLTPEQLRTVDRGDLEDAQHQWAYTCRPQLMQRCFEEGCTAVRPAPLDAYPDRIKLAVVREFMSRNLRP